MNFGIFSNKSSIDFAKKDIVQVYPTVDTYNNTTSYVASTGWAVTILTTGKNTVTAQGTVRSNNGSGAQAITSLVFYLERSPAAAVIIPTTHRVYGFDNEAASNQDVYNGFDIEYTENLQAGDIITLRQRCESAGDACTVFSSASSYGAVMKSVLETAYVNTVQTPRDYINLEGSTAAPARGSVNTNIVRNWTLKSQSVLNGDMTFTPSATLGDYIIVNNPGIYNIFANGRYSGAFTIEVCSNNGSILNVGFGSDTRATEQSNGAGNTNLSVSRSYHLVSGDRVYVRVNGVNLTQSYATTFSVARIGDA